MNETSEKETLENTIKKILPKLIKEYPEIALSIYFEIRDKIMTKDEFKEFLKRFDEHLKNFDEHMKRFDDYVKNHEIEHRQLIEMINKRFEEVEKRFEEINKRFEGVEKRFEEINKRFEEIDKRFEEMHIEMNRRFEELYHADEVRDRNLRKFISDELTKLGRRWGLTTESAFRSAMQGTIEKFFPGYKVERWIQQDEEGFVFGTPAIIEVDVLVKNASTLLIELKSSVSPEDVYIFYRKAEFYERVTGKKPTELAIVTPYLEENAKSVADKLNIKIYVG